MKKTIVTKTNNAVKYFKQNGLIPFLRRSLHAAGLKYFHRSLIFQYRDFNEIPNDFVGQYSLSIPTVDEIEEENDYNDIWFTKEKAIQRLKDGHILFIYREHNRIVYYAWADLNEVTIAWFDLHFKIPPNMVLTTGLYLLPEYRKKGIASEMSKELAIYLKKNGIRYDISAVDPENEASIRVNKRIGIWGAKHYQIVHYRRFWFIKYYQAIKLNSNQKKSFFCIFKPPEELWKVFLPVKL